LPAVAPVVFEAVTQAGSKPVETAVCRCNSPSRMLDEVSLPVTRCRERRAEARCWEHGTRDMGDLKRDEEIMPETVMSLARIE